MIIPSLRILNFLMKIRTCSLIHSSLTNSFSTLRTTCFPPALYVKLNSLYLLNKLSVFPLYYSLTKISSTILSLSDRETMSTSDVSISPFISFSFCSSVTVQKSWRSPGWAPSPENHLTVQSEQGPIPTQPLGKPEHLPDPRLSQPLWRFRRSTNWASSSNPQQPFCQWRVQERRGSENRHENDDHWVYGRDGEKEIEIKYPRRLEGGL